jgi:hypothetical protein
MVYSYSYGVNKNYLFDVLSALVSLCMNRLSEYCEILGSHIGVAEDSSLLGCYALLLGVWFLMFRRIVVSSCSVSNSGT